MPATRTPRAKVMTYSDALDVETRPGRHDTATSHILNAHNSAATTDPALVAALLVARLDYIDRNGWDTP